MLIEPPRYGTSAGTGYPSRKSISSGPRYGSAADIARGSIVLSNHLRAPKDWATGCCSGVALQSSHAQRFTSPIEITCGSKRQTGALVVANHERVLGMRCAATRATSRAKAAGLVRSCSQTRILHQQWPAQLHREHKALLARGLEADPPRPPFHPRR